MNQNERTRLEVLNRMARGGQVIPLGRAMYLIGHSTAHVRFCSTSSPVSSMYKFGINQNTLRADYEVWICGGADLYYLIPVDTIRSIYEDPDAYFDRRHPQICIASVDAKADFATYARGGRALNLSPYLKRTLESLDDYP